MRDTFPWGDLYMVSKAPGPSRRRARRYADRWAAGRTLLRAADPRMAELVDAQPGLDPDRLFDRLPSDLWGALVVQVIGQKASPGSAAAILTRLEALHGGRMPTPAALRHRRRDTARDRDVLRQSDIPARSRRAARRRPPRPRSAAHPRRRRGPGRTH